MNTAITTICVLVFAIAASAAPYIPNDEIKTDGEWRLVTIVLHKGTRSQKTIGKIEYLGREVIGRKNHSLVTPFGTYVWRAPYDHGYRSGWISIDSDMDATTLIPAEIDMREQGNQLFTIMKESQPET